MDDLKELLSAITPPDREAEAASRRHWDSLAKPLGSLGLLEDAVVKIAALTGNVRVALRKRSLVVFCADNGVVAQGVTQTDSSVTAAVACSLARGSSTVCPMARLTRCEVIPVDMGMVDFPGFPGVLDRRVQNSTGDITLGPAMSREECVRAILTGAELAREQKETGVDILAGGEMGIGNTTTSSAVAAVLLGLQPEEVTGRGAGLSTQGLYRKVEAVRRAIAVNVPDPRDPIDVLSKVGGLDLAALCGFYLGCARYWVPVLLDGLISTVAALCAVRLCPNAQGALLASHVSAEPAGKLVLEALGLEPPITAQMRLGEGSGAVAALPLLDMALAVYSGGQTFGELGIEAYTPQK